MKQFPIKKIAKVVEYERGEQMVSCAYDGIPKRLWVILGTPQKEERFFGVTARSYPILNAFEFDEKNRPEGAIEVVCLLNKFDVECNEAVIVNVLENK